MRLSKRDIFSVLSASAIFLVASTAWGHGFEVSQNNFTSMPTQLTVSSMQPVLDNALPPPGQGYSSPFATPGPSNLFTDEFGGAPMTNGPLIGNGGASYYETFEGFVALDGVTNDYDPVTGIDNGTQTGTWGIQSATFNILSPLYYANGNGTAACRASTGTYLQFSVNPAIEPPNGPVETPTAPLSGPFSQSPPPAGAAGIAVINGSTSVVAGFPVTGSIFHELLKDLYIAPDSMQTYGEYGYAFDATFTLTPSPLAVLANPELAGDIVTLTTPPMVDVFGLSDPNLNYDPDSNPNGGDFADDAPVGQQDIATMQIYDAAMASAQAVPEPSTFLLAGIGFFACAFAVWRRRFTARVLSPCRACERSRPYLRF